VRFTTPKHRRVRDNTSERPVACRSKAAATSPSRTPTSSGCSWDSRCSIASVRSGTCLEVFPNRSCMSSARQQSTSA
jgi:hypothetical protein